MLRTIVSVHPSSKSYMVTIPAKLAMYMAIATILRSSLRVGQSSSTCYNSMVIAVQVLFIVKLSTYAQIYVIRVSRANYLRSHNNVCAIPNYRSYVATSPELNDNWHWTYFIVQTRIHSTVTPNCLRVIIQLHGLLILKWKIVCIPLRRT